LLNLFFKKPQWKTNGETKENNISMFKLITPMCEINRLNGGTELKSNSKYIAHINQNIQHKYLSPYNRFSIQEFENLQEGINLYN
jgi:hypothetical protein